MTNRTRELLLWAYAMSSQHSWFTWVMHGLLAIPVAALLFMAPSLAVFVVFGYREAEQVLHKVLTKRTIPMMAKVDHVLDVLVPGIVGYVILG